VWWLLTSRVTVATCEHGEHHRHKEDWKHAWMFGFQYGRFWRWRYGMKRRFLQREADCGCYVGRLTGKGKAVFIRCPEHGLYAKFGLTPPDKEHDVSSTQ